VFLSNLLRSKLYTTTSKPFERTRELNFLKLSKNNALYGSTINNPLKDFRDYCRCSSQRGTRTNYKWSQKRLLTILLLLFLLSKLTLVDFILLIQIKITLFGALQGIQRRLQNCFRKSFRRILDRLFLKQYCFSLSQCAACNHHWSSDTVQANHSAPWLFFSTESSSKLSFEVKQMIVFWSTFWRYCRIDAKNWWIAFVSTVPSIF